MTTRDTVSELTDERLRAKLAEIRHQLQCNIEIIKRGHPDPEPRILPHTIEIVTGHVEDRLKELEALLASALSHRSTTGEAVAETAEAIITPELEAQLQALASPSSTPTQKQEPVAVEVKPLEWSDMTGSGTRFRSWGGLIGYTISRITQDGEQYFRWAREQSSWSDVFYDADSCKAAAQSDYESRIRSALIASPTQQVSEEWQPIETAPKDGTLVVLTWMDDGRPLEQWPMRWAHIQRNGLFPGVVGMWTAPDGSLTWNDDRGAGPTHWRLPQAPPALSHEPKGNEHG